MTTFYYWHAWDIDLSADDRDSHNTAPAARAFPTVEQAVDDFIANFGEEIYGDESYKLPTKVAEKLREELVAVEEIETVDFIKSCDNHLVEIYSIEIGG